MEEVSKRRHGVFVLRDRLEPSLVTNILKVIYQGWMNALENPTFRPDTCEVEMNARLVDGMRFAVNQHSIPSAKYLTVLPAVESRSLGASIPDGFPDISIHLQDLRERIGDHGPHVVIECKRVTANQTDLCRLYVRNGIDRFKHEKYASGHETAFMVGYVISGSLQNAKDSVNHALNTAGRTSEQLGKSTLVDCYSWTFTSRHFRSVSRTTITLYHAMLEI